MTFQDFHLLGSGFTFVKIVKKKKLYYEKIFFLFFLEFQHMTLEFKKTLFKMFFKAFFVTYNKIFMTLCCLF